MSAAGRSPLPAGLPVPPGFRLPPEWARHEATWLVWPHCTDTWPGVDLTEAAEPAYVEMVRALAGSETVNVCVQTDDHRAVVAERLRREGVASGERAPVQLVIVPTDDEWIRDFGALTLVGPGGQRLMTDWTFNAWGGKYDRTEQNNRVPAAMAAHHGVERARIDVVLEGGSVDVDGTGLVLTTEACLLNPNRNPHLGRADVERVLADGLGATETIWLGDGIAGDDTDGHVDDFARFVGPRAVVVAAEPDPADANHAPLADARARLQAWRGRDGRGLRVETLPMPAPLFHTTADGETERLPASHANFLIANTVVLMPAFGGPSDREAAETLARLLPGRRVVPVDSARLAWGLGACHCLSQHVPAAGL